MKVKLKAKKEFEPTILIDDRGNPITFYRKIDFVEAIASGNYREKLDGDRTPKSYGKEFASDLAFEKKQEKVKLEKKEMLISDLKIVRSKLAGTPR